MQLSQNIINLLVNVNYIYIYCLGCINRRTAEKVLSKEVATNVVSSYYRPVDIVTKSLRGANIQFICSKLRAFNLYFQT